MDDVHGTIVSMKTVPAGSFKQTCLRLLDEVAETGEPIVVTKRGRPVAQVVPIPRLRRESWRGAMAGQGTILGDIIAPAAEEDEWEVLDE